MVTSTPTPAPAFEPGRDPSGSIRSLRLGRRPPRALVQAGLAAPPLRGRPALARDAIDETRHEDAVRTDVVPDMDQEADQVARAPEHDRKNDGPRDLAEECRHHAPAPEPDPGYELRDDRNDQEDRCRLEKRSDPPQRRVGLHVAPPHHPDPAPVPGTDRALVPVPAESPLVRHGPPPVTPSDRAEYRRNEARVTGPGPIGTGTRKSRQRNAPADRRAARRTPDRCEGPRLDQSRTGVPGAGRRTPLRRPDRPRLACRSGLAARRPPPRRSTRRACHHDRAPRSGPGGSSSHADGR